MRNTLPLALAITCGLLACNSGGGGGGSGAASTIPCAGGCPANVPIDSDGDGRKDYVLCGDFDGDGRLTMDRGCTSSDPSTPCDAPGEKGDLLACLEALDDGDGRTLEILPGRYEVPDEPFTAHNAPPFGAEAGLLEIPSNTTLRCRPGAVLTGTDERHRDDRDQLSVLYVPSTSTNVLIEGCEIDGGWPDGYDCVDGCQPITRMGIFLKGMRNVVRDNVVHHTRHSCIYTKDGSWNEITGNQLDWCGGSWSSVRVSRYPGIYVFSDGGVPVDGLRIADTRCDRTFSACINTRLQTDSDRNAIRGLVVERTTHVATGTNRDGSTPPCMLLRGLEDARITDSLCTGTSGIGIVAGSGRYREDPGCSTAAGTWTECANANRGISLQRTTLRHTRDAPALSIGGYSDDVLVQDLVVEDVAQQPCIVAPGASRRIVLEDVRLESCGNGGMRLGLSSATQSWGELDPLETIELRDVHIVEADASLLDGRPSPGIRFQQGCVGCRLERVHVAGFTDAGLSVDTGHVFADNTLSDVTLTQWGSWYAGTRLHADLPLCTAATAGEVYTVADSGSVDTCEALPGASDSNLCACDGAAWRDTEALGGTRPDSLGVDLLDAIAVENNLITNLRCNDVRARRHCVELPPGASGNVFEGLYATDSRGLSLHDSERKDANDGALHLHGAVGNTVLDVLCQGLRNETDVGRPCVCLAEPCVSP